MKQYWNKLLRFLGIRKSKVTTGRRARIFVNGVEVAYMNELKYIVKHDEY